MVPCSPESLATGISDPLGLRPTAGEPPLFLTTCYNFSDGNINGTRAFHCDAVRGRFGEPVGGASKAPAASVVSHPRSTRFRLTGKPSFRHNHQVLVNAL